MLGFLTNIWDLYKINLIINLPKCFLIKGNKCDIPCCFLFFLKMRRSMQENYKGRGLHDKNTRYF